MARNLRGDIYRNKSGEDAVIRNFIQDAFHLEQYLMMGGNVVIIGNIYENPAATHRMKLTTVHLTEDQLAL